MTQRFVFFGTWAATVLITLALLPKPCLASKKSQAPKPRTLAQKLVEEAAAKNPEVSEVELAVRSSNACSTIADSAHTGIGEKCDHDEFEAMRTGEPVIEKEKDGFDVTMPLHDMTGNIIGTVGLDFKAEPGQQKSSVAQKAKKIVQEIEAQIPAVTKLSELVD